MLFFLSVVSASGQTLQAGEALPQGIDIQVSEAGLDSLATALPALLPTDDLVIDDVAEESGFGCLGYSYSLSNLFLDLQILGASIRAEPGELILDVDLSMSVNEPGDQFTMALDAICLIDESCDGHVLPFNMSFSAPLSLTVEGEPGAKSLLASIGTLEITHDLTSDELAVGCGLQDLEAVLNLFGSSSFDLILGLFEDTLVEQIDGPLNDGLTALAIQETLEVGDATVDLNLQPESVTITDAGLELVLATQFSGEAHPCVASYDPGEIMLSGGPPPTSASNPLGTHLAANLSQDMVDQALYSFWRGGLLCQELGADAGIDLAGLSLDTTLLGLIAGDAYGDLFPEASPLTLLTDPQVPPRALVIGDHDLAVEIEDLGLDFLAEFDGRTTRILGLDIDGEIGVDLPFDPKSGALSVGIDLGDDALTTSLTSDPVVADAELLASEMGASLSGLLDGVLGGLLGDTLAFALPTFEGTGLLDLTASTSGAQSDWLAVRASVGTVEYEGTDLCGCNADPKDPYYDPYADPCGCDSSGCAMSGTGGIGWVGLLVGVLLRRREANS